MRAMTRTSPGPATIMIANWTLIEDPLVEKNVCLAPTPSAKSSCAVDCTCQARSRVSTPWLIGRSKRAASIPAHWVNSAAGPRPPLCAGMLNDSNQCERLADERERAADEREGNADERERERLERAEAGAERVRESEARQQASIEREIAASERAAAAPDEGARAEPDAAE